MSSSALIASMFTISNSSLFLVRIWFSSSLSSCSMVSLYLFFSFNKISRMAAWLTLICETGSFFEKPSRNFFKLIFSRSWSHSFCCWNNDVFFEHIDLLGTKTLCNPIPWAIQGNNYPKVPLDQTFITNKNFRSNSLIRLLW